METAIVLKRGAGHNDSDAFGQDFAKRTAIREWSLHHGKEIERKDMGRFVPQATLEALERRPLLDWDPYWAMLQYQLMLLSHAELRNIYQVEEGIEYRLKKEAEDAADFIPLHSAHEEQALDVGPAAAGLFLYFVGDNQSRSD